MTRQELLAERTRIQKTMPAGVARATALRSLDAQLAKLNPAPQKTSENQIRQEAVRMAREVLRRGH